MNTLKCYTKISLNNLLHFPDGEERFKKLINDFSCPLNQDVEHFLKSTAIHNQLMNLSRTTLICIHKDDGSMLLTGYYALALQVIDLDRISSKSLRKKITGFKRENKLGAAVYLIGQLGKNFSNSTDTLISGQKLFTFAMQDILNAHHAVGGRIVVVECKNDDNLRHFYEDTLGFQLIDTADDESMVKYMTMISAYK